MTTPQKFERILADVTAYVRAHPGCTRSELAAMVTGSNGAITFAVGKLLADGFVVQRAKRRLWPVPAPDVEPARRVAVDSENHSEVG